MSPRKKLWLRNRRMLHAEMSGEHLSPREKLMMKALEKRLADALGMAQLLATDESFADTNAKLIVALEERDAAYDALHDPERSLAEALADVDRRFEESLQPGFTLEPEPLPERLKAKIAMICGRIA